MSPPATHEYPQKISAHSVQPFGRLYMYEYMVLLYSLKVVYGGIHTTVEQKDDI